MYIKRVEEWERTFEHIWDDNETVSAAEVLARYETIASAALASHRWIKGNLRRSLEHIYDGDRYTAFNEGATR